MHIAIDITPLESGHKDRGVGTYTKLLIEALQKYESNHSYYFFTRGQKIPNAVELIHYPYFDPFFVTLPFVYSKLTVITVHDLTPLVFPQHFPAGIRGALKWHYQRARLTCARRVITDSFSSKRDIEHIAGFPEAQIDVVPLAASPKFGQVKDKAELARVKKQYHLPESFVLYVGDVNWNKNIMGMLEAFQKVKSQKSKVKSGNQEIKQDVKLVLVGKAFIDRLSEADAIQASINRLGIRDKVMTPGFVPFEDLPALYSLASVYIQPSHYEGFGLPVLEAMACGTPVVSSRAASLAEIAGPAIAVDPSDPQDIARGLLKALTMTPVKRKALIAAQTKWVQQFSWERVAHQTIESYEKAIS